MSSTSSKPVRTLREHMTALEADFAVCLAQPTKKAVHKLRSHTRRVEAMLFLLDRLLDMPPHRTEARALTKKLKVLRRAAGRVRDLDVHLEHLAELRNEFSDAAELTEVLKKRRERKSKTLAKVLRKHEAGLAGAIEGLWQALRPAEPVEVAAQTVLEIAHAAFSRVNVPAKKLEDERLHSIRKAAKTMRYLAESAGGGQRARLAARSFEALQASGGAWHDTLELAAAATDALGRKRRLSVALRKRCEQRRREFLTALQRAAAAKR